ncbi:MAG: class I SAM-dependent methyltransferase [Candidatus Muirbacterium halophilum]|nr:class I SAM-dependent methyltransferase [Candidatus Muirbacterium halophilum]MCK9474640.1 class I SAM-dependent methyltransferase [Candidatus Muirbacterium halophilum]
MRNWDKQLQNITHLGQKLDGCMKDREVRLIAFIANVLSEIDGNILEIGSYKGKSTIILAKSANLKDNEKIYAVDPMINTTKTDPYSKELTDLELIFKNNLKNNNVEKYVELFKMKSEDLAPDWNKELKFLWIDGDHTYDGTWKDFNGFAKWVKPGGIVAIHDVLNGFEGSLRVFMENVVLSNEYGACGLCGSIGWGQKIKNFDNKYLNNKVKLYKKLTKMVPYLINDAELKGWNKFLYKFHRAFVPNKERDYEKLYNLIKEDLNITKK